MKLFTSTAPAVSASTLKIKVAAAYQDKKLSVEETTLEAATKLSPLGILPALEIDGETIVESFAIFRYICGDNTALVGTTAFEQAQVNDWLDLCSSTIDVLATAAIAPIVGLTIGDGIKNSSLSDVGKASAQDLFGVLNRFVEKHLQTRTFLVGERLSAADLALACSLVQPMKLLVDPKRQKNLKNTVRWFKTVVAHEKCAKSFGAIEFCASAPAFDGKKSKAPVSQNKGKPAPMRAPEPDNNMVGNRAPSKGTTQISELFSRSRVRVKEIMHSVDGGESMIGKTIKVCGWARTVREGAKGALAFVELNDGSCFESIQVVCSRENTKNIDSVFKAGGTGASFQFIGTLIESPAKGQKVELSVTEAQVLGNVDALKYPLKKNRKGHSVEFLREVAHLRPRTNLIGAVARVRNAMAFATHQFYNARGFNYVHTPIVTASDCEGAGEMFQVTTLLPEDKSQPVPRVEKKDPKVAEGTAKEGDIDYQKDFFKRPSFLTVSGQLNVECFACALSDVYTFGPTFRAENSHTSRHLAEFWMIEPEICFANLDDNMDLAEDYIKYCVQYALDHCMSDLKFFESRVEKGLLARLYNIIEKPFKRLPYTEAIKVLNEPKNLKKGKFEEKPEWGIDLGSEHERFLTEQVYKQPVILTDYPADIKAFYMRQNEPDAEGRLTVQAMDVLVPKIGELAGGSAREERLDRLEQRIKELELEPEDFSWYMDLRRYGSVPHAGFGVGFERLILFVTGVENIRDVIPFPRTPGVCAF